MSVGSEYVRLAKPEDIDYIAARMREADRQEVWSSSRRSPRQALLLSFKESIITWTAETKDGDPFIMFGVGRRSIMSDVGVPWLLGTDEVDNMRVQFVKKSRFYVMQMLEVFPALENHVDCRNTTSIAWLKWCGFKMDDPAPYGHDNLLFRRFFMGGTYV